jgi:type IV secretory pathway VirB10-like protein
MVHSSDFGRMARALLLGLTVFALAGDALAQWAWKDDNGRVVYSDRPPPSGVKSGSIVRQPSNAQTVLPPQQAGAAADSQRPATEGRPPAASNAPKTVAEQEMEFRKRQIERAEAEKKAQDEQQRNATKAAECERAKGYLKAVEDGQRIARTDASGNREFLDDSQRVAEAERARKIMQSTCGN